MGFCINEMKKNRRTLKYVSFRFTTNLYSKLWIMTSCFCRTRLLWVLTIFSPWKIWSWSSLLSRFSGRGNTCPSNSYLISPMIRSLLLRCCLELCLNLSWDCSTATYPWLFCWDVSSFGRRLTPSWCLLCQDSPCSQTLLFFRGRAPCRGKSTRGGIDLVFLRIFRDLWCKRHSEPFWLWKGHLYHLQLIVDWWTPIFIQSK